MMLLLSMINKNRIVSPMPSIGDGLTMIPWSEGRCLAWDATAELSTGRMDPRVGSGRVGSRFCRILAGWVESGQHWIFQCVTDYFLVPSNTTFGLIDFLRYLIYNN